MSPFSPGVRSVHVCDNQLTAQMTTTLEKALIITYRCTGHSQQLHEKHKEDIIECCMCGCKYVPHGNMFAKITSLVEGELSEPDELTFESSSTDMDFPLRLWCRDNKRGAVDYFDND